MNNEDLDILLIEETKEEKVYECPICKAGKITIYKQSIKKYGYCDVCDATYIDYIPLPHQVEVHKSKSKVKLLIGGVGSAKSDNAVMEIINHAVTVPNGYTMMLAQTLKQLGAAIMPKFMAYLPDKYVDKWQDTLATKKITLTNGHIIEGFASDNEEKFRSLNTTAFYIEEASGIAPAVFRECLNRLRNPMGVIDGQDHFLGLVVSNPSQGFIRDLLFEANKIHGSASIKNTVEHYKDRVVNPNPELEAFLSSSRDNPYLPKGFIDRIISSSTPAQVKLYIDCIIEYAEGAVYPEFLSYVVDDFKIPDHWERYLAHDLGIKDPAAILLCAIDPTTKIIYAYKEFYKTDQVLTEIANSLKQMIADIPQGMLKPMLIDPSSNQRNKINGKTYKQQMNLEHKLIFQDANNNIIDGLYKTRDLMSQGKFRVFRSCVQTIREGCEYRYANEREQNMKKNLGDKPLDKDNHLMDCLRYIVQALPYNILDKEVIRVDNSWRSSFLISAEKSYEGGFRF